jgi:hypothetical protein
VAEVERAAIKRLDVEAALSHDALVAGGKKADEVEILQTWTDYYVGALSAMSDIEVGGSSAQTVLAIDKARGRVKSAGAARIAALR